MPSNGDWLPPGWTEEDMYNKTDEEWDALTEEQYARINAHQKSVSEDQQAINDEHVKALDAQRRIRDQPDYLKGTNAGGGAGIEANIAQIIDQNGLQEFGFVIFRIRDSSEADDTRWESLKQSWATLTCDGREGIGNEIERVGVDGHGHPWPVWKWMDHSAQDLRTLDIAEITRCFAQLQEAGDVPEGLDHGMALAIDSEALASFDHSKSMSDNGDDDEKYSGPWVYAVDLTSTLNEDDEDDEDEDEDPEVKGYFKVAVGSLLTDLWPFLAGQSLFPDELEAMVEEGGVWQGVM